MVIQEKEIILLSAGSKLIFRGDIYISDGLNWVFYSEYNPEEEIDLYSKPDVKINDWVKLKNVEKPFNHRKGIVSDIFPDCIEVLVDKQRVILQHYMYEPTLPKHRRNVTTKVDDKETGGSYYKVKEQETGIENSKRFTTRQRLRFDKLRSDFRTKRRNRGLL